MLYKCTIYDVWTTWAQCIHIQVDDLRSSSQTCAVPSPWHLHKSEHGIRHQTTCCNCCIILSYKRVHERARLHCQAQFIDSIYHPEGHWHLRGLPGSDGLSKSTFMNQPISVSHPGQGNWVYLKCLCPHSLHVDQSDIDSFQRRKKNNLMRCGCGIPSNWEFQTMWIILNQKKQPSRILVNLDHKTFDSMKKNKK